MSNDELLMELVRAGLLLVMAAIGITTLLLSRQLNRRIQPLSEKLARAHHEMSELESVLSELHGIKSRYIHLLEHVDDVDTAEFSAGVIETLRLSVFRRDITAADAQSWIRQAPGILISLGLLGTFIGLTVGLSQIGGVLASNLSPAAAMGALSQLVTPMGTAFQTSLMGLLLSLIILIWTQITGTRTCLERCESLLSSWLETVLPRQLGRQIMTPLRQSLVDLNDTSQRLPEQIFLAVEQGMQKAFAAKLNDIFNRHAELATEAQTAVRTLTSFASALNESGQDFVEAAQAFRQSDFADTLERSVLSLVESREQLNISTNALSNRLNDVSENLMSTQAEWRLIAKTSEQELASCRALGEQITDEIRILHNATQALNTSTQTTTEASKQLREARLEVMRDRKLAIETATAIQQRLEADSSAAESCQVFASALEAALGNWNRNTERLDSLTLAFVEAVKKAKLEGDQDLNKWNQNARRVIEELQQKLQQDLSRAVEEQRRALADVAQPAQSAQSVAQNVLLQLEQLQGRISGLNSISLVKQDNQGRP